MKLMSAANRLGLITCILLLAGNIQAKEKSFVNLEALPDIAFGLWSAGDGSQARTSLVCAASSNYNDAFNDPPPVEIPPAVHLPYNFRAVDRDTAGSYVLYLDGDTANTGNATIQVSLSHRDIKQGAGYEVLTESIYDSHAHVGQFKNCNNGDNSELQVSITSAELEQSRAGLFSGRMKARIRGGTDGITTSKNQNFAVSISIANIVKVSALNDIVLGAWSGVGNITREETFCVYSNNAAAAYTVAISSAYQDAGGNFFLKNAAQTQSIPYTLQFIDSAVLPGGTVVSTTPIAGTGNNAMVNCGGADNTKLTVTINQPDLQISKTDNYDDTLILLVAPI